jgi:hypothetical protein
MGARVAPVLPSEEGLEVVRYLTLAEARALECNGCGDCCDSRRTDGFWTWGALPEDGYRSLTGGERLIIPIDLVDGEWRDRAQRPEDAAEFTPTRFRCMAFAERADGTGSCLRHGQPRPPKCGEFPVWGPEIEAELREQHEVQLHTGAFPRCAWYQVVVVEEGDPRALCSVRDAPRDVAEASAGEVAGVVY